MTHKEQLVDYLARIECEVENSENPKPIIEREGVELYRIWEEDKVFGKTKKPETNYTPTIERILEKSGAGSKFFEETLRHFTNYLIEKSREVLKDPNTEYVEFV